MHSYQEHDTCFTVTANFIEDPAVDDFVIRAETFHAVPAILPTIRELAPKI
jgi:hypothetical protein